jgi:hypothetical protein
VFDRHFSPAVSTWTRHVVNKEFSALHKTGVVLKEMYVQHTDQITATQVASLALKLVDSGKLLH